jgi:hypothetical protein
MSSSLISGLSGWVIAAGSADRTGKARGNAKKLAESNNSARTKVGITIPPMACAAYGTAHYGML